MKKLFYAFLLLASASIFVVQAKAQVIVIANPSVKASEVSKNDLKDVFTGASTSLGGSQRCADPAQSRHRPRRVPAGLYRQERYRLSRRLAQSGLFRPGHHAQEPGRRRRRCGVRCPQRRRHRLHRQSNSARRRQSSCCQVTLELTFGRRQSTKASRIRQKDEHAVAMLPVRICAGNMSSSKFGR